MTSREVVLQERGAPRCRLEGPGMALRAPRGLEAALTLTGSCRMHKLLEDHKIPLKCDCREGDLGSSTHSCLGTLRTLGGELGTGSSKSNVHL